MALIRMNMWSEQLTMQVPLTVLVPHRTPEETAAGKRHKVLYLLHGATGDHSDWTRFTSIERYDQKQDFVIVMPSARMSRYHDMAHGGRYFSFIADELPAVLGRMFPLSPAREDNYICGLSMGGAGALRIGLHRPDQYAAIGCLSAGLSNYGEWTQNDPNARRAFELVMGDKDPAGEMAEMEGVVRKLASVGEPVPRVYHCCGSEDFLLANAHYTKSVFESIPGDPFSYTYEEDPGAHTWAYWDEHIQHFLNWL